MKNKMLNFQYNTDEFGDPISVYIENELKQVSPISISVQLNQIPDEFHRVVVVDDSENTLFEVFDNEEIVDGSFKVNYSNGVVWLSPSCIGKTFKFTYYGRGVELIHASRIVFSDGKTLEEKLNY